MKIRPVRSELFSADSRTDGRKDIHEETNSRISQFYDRPKTCEISGSRRGDNKICVLSCHALLLGRPVPSLRRDLLLP